MHRAWLQYVIGLVLLLLCRPALAFHTGATFDNPPGQGGAGGVFYTGVPSERGWNCTACHINSAGLIRINLSSMPASLLQNSTYTGNQSYVITVNLGNEHLGLSAGLANQNGFALTIRDGKGQPSGKISGFDPAQIYLSGNATVSTTGLTPRLTAWTFTWTAPAPGTGPVTVYIGMVDGDGASATPGQMLNDPFNDDVAIGMLVLHDSSVSAQLSVPPAAPLDLSTPSARRLVALAPHTTRQSACVSRATGLVYARRVGHTKGCGRTRVAA